MRMRHEPVRVLLIPEIHEHLFYLTLAPDELMTFTDP